MITIKNINNNSLSKLYSICFGTKTSYGRTIHVWDDKPFGNWSNANPATTTSMTVGQWLTAFSDAAYNAQNGTDGLFDSFNSIIELIKLAAQAWQVDDSMGDRIEYLSAVPVTNKDGNGTINNNVTVDENGDIFWNILASSVDDNITNITTNEDGSMASGVLGYTYKYKVKLDNLGDYVAGTDVPTNTEATLDYMVTDDKGEWIPELLTGTFPVPEVEGLQGSLEFTKTDDQGKALAGAEFTLALKSEGKWTSMTATSDANGKVSFTGIPSGHDFVLTESGTPEGYVSANPIDVSVSFGNTTAKGFEGTASAPTVINIRKVAEVAVTKTFEGLPKELWPAVTVTLSNGTNTYSALLNADNNWAVEIEDLAKRPLGRSSGGELQRVLLALAINPTPDLLVLDEPVSGVDQNGLKLFLDTVVRLKEQHHMAILLVSHDLNLVRQYADHVVLLDKSVLVQGAPDAVFASPEFQMIFGVGARNLQSARIHGAGRWTPRVTAEQTDEEVTE